MIDWDFEAGCPKCGEIYSFEMDADKGADMQEVKCDECGTVFIVKAKAELNIDVETFAKVDK